MATIKSRRYARVPEQQDVQFKAQQRTVGPTQEIDEDCKQPEGS